MIFSYRAAGGLWVEGTIVKEYDSVEGRNSPVFTASSEQFPKFAGVGITVHAAVNDFKARLPNWIEVNPDAKLGLT